MESIEIALAMLLAVLVSGYLVRVLPFSLPLPLVQIALGAAIAAVSSHGVRLDPHIFFLLFIPPLLFLDGWRIPKDGLFRDKGLILELALGLVLFTVIGAGFLIHWMIPAMPLPVAFALAAIISPTDPIAVSAIAARAPIPKRLMHILEGESLLNDATGLVCFRFAVAAAVSGSFSIASASLSFLWVALAGLAIGAGLTLGVKYAQHWLSHRLGEDNGAPILISLLLPFGAYLAAEGVHASGILAAVAAGITMSYVELRGRVPAAARVQRTAVWDTVQFVLNGIMFVLLGEQLPMIFEAAVLSVEHTGQSNPGWLLVYAFAISAMLAGLRFVWVWATMTLNLLKRPYDTQPLHTTNWRIIAATSLAGARGAITLAGVMTLPLTLADGTAFPARDLVIFLATAVILISLAAASIALPRLLKGLELPPEAAASLEKDLARREAARAAIAEIEHVQSLRSTSLEQTQLYIQAAGPLLTLYQRRLRDGGPQNDPSFFNQVDEAENVLRKAALKAERQQLFTMARAGRISDATCRKLVHAVDLTEARLPASPSKN